MRYVIALDIGIRNMGICVYDNVCSKIVYWDNVPLMTGRYVPMNNVQYVRDFVRRMRHYFDEASNVIVERQMRCNMRIIEALLQSTFFDICTVISARSIKVHYNLSRGNYRLNKQAAVEWVETFVNNNMGIAFGVNATAAFDAKGAKRDDLADSLLLLLYYLDTYSNQLSSDSNE
jgi:hypothetical protein